ncbi:MAG: hypothetical protein GY847_27440 [Proteobacteria bacterium]|nr:hypothetical protein [Pseudomonadota bacterium]
MQSYAPKGLVLVIFLSTSHSHSVSAETLKLSSESKPEYCEDTNCGEEATCRVIRKKVVCACKEDSTPGESEEETCIAEVDAQAIDLNATRNELKKGQNAFPKSASKKDKGLNDCRMRNAKIIKGLGTGLIVLGPILFATGGILVANASAECNKRLAETEDFAGDMTCFGAGFEYLLGFGIAGIISLAAGIPMTIVGHKRQVRFGRFVSSESGGRPKGKSKSLSFKSAGPMVYKEGLLRGISLSFSF